MKKILIFLTIISYFSFGKENISWYKVPFPPYFIVEGESKNQGSMDLMLDYYTKKLKDFDHKFEVVSLNRVLELAKQGAYMGTPLLLQSQEREEFLVFSEPYDFILSNHFIIKKDSYKLYKNYIDKDGFIDLTKVFGNKEFSVGLEVGRVYHKSLTPLIENSSNIDYTYGMDSMAMILKKLQAGRVLGTIEYPEVIAYLTKSRKIPLEYMALPIKGTDPYNLLRFSFPKNEWGVKMVSNINPLIREFIKTKEYENIALKWSPEKKKYLTNFRTNHH